MRTLRTTALVLLVLFLVSCQTIIPKPDLTTEGENCSAHYVGHNNYQISVHPDDMIYVGEPGSIFTPKYVSSRTNAEGRRTTIDCVVTQWTSSPAGIVEEKDGQFTLLKPGFAQITGIVNENEGSRQRAVSYEVVSLPASTEEELNNGTATATTLESTRPHYGIIQGERDVDYFRFVVPAGSSFEIGVDTAVDLKKATRYKQRELSVAIHNAQDEPFGEERRNYQNNTGQDATFYAVISSPANETPTPPTVHTRPEWDAAYQIRLYLNDLPELSTPLPGPKPTIDGNCSAHNTRDSNFLIATSGSTLFIGEPQDTFTPEYASTRVDEEGYEITLACAVTEWSSNPAGVVQESNGVFTLVNTGITQITGVVKGSPGAPPATINYEVVNLPVPTEIESNNSYAYATFIEANETHYGAIRDGRDIDYYRFVVPAQSSFEIRIDPSVDLSKAKQYSQGELTLAIHNANDEFLGFEHRTYQNTTDQDATFFAVVSSPSNAAYQIHYETGALPGPILTPGENCSIHNTHGSNYSLSVGSAGKLFIGTPNSVFVPEYLSTRDDADKSEVALDCIISEWSSSPAGIVQEQDGEFILTTPGVARITGTVRGSGGASRKTITYEVINLPTPTETESNNGQQRATPLEANESHFGMISHELDLDYYQIVVPANGLFQVNVSPAIDFSQAEEYAQHAFAVQIQDDTGGSYGPIYKLLENTTGADLTLYVVISHFDDPETPENANRAAYEVHYELFP